MKKLILFLLVTNLVFLSCPESAGSKSINTIKTIKVASLNPVKIAAVEQICKEYAFLSSAKICSEEISSLVRNQPLSLEETLQGAMNRAKNGFNSCDLSFGIESGLFQVPYTKTGYMNICACVIYDGSNFYVGLSSAFECPDKATDLMVKDGFEMKQTFNKLGITTDSKGNGVVGILTNGRVDRIEYTKQAIVMALIKLENGELYDKLS